jgi:carotenoid cleavage dioxygenase
MVYLEINFPSLTCRKSSVNVIDAKTMSANPVAVVELPHRVPYGFHAFFVSEVSVILVASGLCLI